MNIQIFINVFSSPRGGGGHRGGPRGGSAVRGGGAQGGPPRGGSSQSRGNNKKQHKKKQYDKKKENHGYSTYGLTKDFFDKKKKRFRYDNIFVVIIFLIQLTQVETTNHSFTGYDCTNPTNHRLVPSPCVKQVSWNSKSQYAGWVAYHQGK